MGCDGSKRTSRKSTTNMRPSNKQNFKLNPNIPSGWEVDKVGVEKIRFSDGSIKQY